MKATIKTGDSFALPIQFYDTTNPQAQLAIQTFVAASELYANKTGFLATTPLGALVTS